MGTFFFTITNITICTIPDTPQAGPSGVSHDDPTQVPSPAVIPNSTPPVTQAIVGLGDLKAMFAELVCGLHTKYSLAMTNCSLQINPLREQVQALQAELQLASGRLANVTSLELQVTELTNEVVALRSSTLGKRSRDLDDEPPVDAEAPKTVAHPSEEIRPLKKRAKLEEGSTAGPSTVHRDGGAEENDDMVEPIHYDPGPTFTIFSGPEEPPEKQPEEQPFNPPTPTTHLSDLFPITTPRVPSFGGFTTSTANANENQIPTTGVPNSAFSFVFPTSDFQPVTSTPAGGPLEMGVPLFPYPEPPTSPTPGSDPTGGYIDRGGRRERNDLFRPTGPPSRPPSHPSRPRSSASSRARSESHSRPTGLTVPQPNSSSEPPCISPAALMRNPGLPSLPESEAERTPVHPRRNPAAILGMGIGVGMVGLPIQMTPDTPAPPMKRTMYGTELDADTRFGDFGVEGVAMGFWSGAAPRI